MDSLILDIDKVLSDFIKGQVQVKNYLEYTALERIAILVNKARKANGPTKTLDY